MRLVALVVFGLSVVGCVDEPVTRRPARSTADKAALFGDPGLVPTREGEAARTEAARAGELEAAVRILHGVESARVDVELGEVDRALVVLRLTDSAHEDVVLASARRIAASILGEDLAADAVFEVTAPAVAHSGKGPTDSDFPTLPFGVAVLGLGFSLGVTFDRARRVLRHRRRRRARQRQRS